MWLCVSVLGFNSQSACGLNAGKKKKTEVEMSTLLAWSSNFGSLLQFYINQGHNWSQIDKREGFVLFFNPVCTVIIYIYKCCSIF